MNRCVARGLTTKLLCVAAGALAWAGAASAQSFPDRPVSVLFASGPGSSTDALLRTMAGEVSKRLGQPVTVENRPGGNGTLGLIAVTRAKPDGHTLTVMQDGVMTQLPLMDAGFKLEAGKDYLPISFLLEYPLIVIANARQPYRNMKEMISFARQNPGKLNFVIQQGTGSHIFAEQIKQAAGINLTLVPYKSSTMAMPDLIAGQVELSASNVSAQPLVQSGKLIALASASKERWAPFPNTPTMIEQGLPITFSNWWLLVGAAGTPRDTVDRLWRTFGEVMKLPNITPTYAANGLLSFPDMKPDEITERARAEAKIWAPVIRNANIKIE